MKNLAKKYRHILAVLYLPFYLICFFFLERTVTTDFTPLNSPLDDFLPFIAVFIIPYIAWFFYVGASCVYFFFASQRDFLKMVSFLFFGMTVYLLICWIFPNGLRDYRPSQFSPTMPFNGLISWLYATDTSTNVFPSIHVFNSIGVHIAINRTDRIKHKWIKHGSLVLCILICLSTVFLKQHALIDVFGGCVMAGITYHLVYRTKYSGFIDRRTWHTADEP